MASDEDYMAFLDKANRDPNEGRASAAAASSSSKSPFKALDKGAKVPGPIAEILAKKKDLVYTSDADEPFEPVVLAWDEGGNTLPDEGNSLPTMPFSSIRTPFSSSVEA